MNIRNIKKFRSVGFTLVEMAVVLVILGLMLGGLLLPLTAQMDQRNLGEARLQIREIEEALIGYALATGRLPCSADPAIATGDAGAGEERDCSVVGMNAGVLPWVTLGLKETDPWGRRFSYRVTAQFADTAAANTYSGCVPNPVPDAASFALCSLGDMTILNNAGGGNVALNVPAVVVSHGKGGAGAYLTTGEQQLPASADLSERENSLLNATFVSKTIDSSYDDVTGWVPRMILFNRMVSAALLP